MKNLYLLLILCFLVNLGIAQNSNFSFNSEESSPSSSLTERNPDFFQNYLKAWNLQFNYPLNANIPSQAGIETDGSFFYVTKWNSDSILKYDINGNYVSVFTISGVTGLRDLAYDGTYFYGGNTGSTIYEMDFVNESLVSTISCPSGTEIRNIAYDSDNDGFWVGNWATDIDLISRTGSLLNSIPSSSHGLGSMYGSAYDNITPGGPYLWVIIANGSLPINLYMINIASGLVNLEYDITGDIGGGSLGGGLFIHPNLLPGKITLGGLVQSEAIFGYDLEAVIDSMDVGVIEVISPVSGVNLSATEQVEVKIKNYGWKTLTGFQITYTANGANPVSESFTQNIAFGEEVNFVFTQGLDLSVVGQYSIEVKTELTGDMNTDNDAMTKKVFCLSNSAEKMLLVEHFTQASCGPCAAQNPALDALITSNLNINKVAHIAYHTHWPGTDPMFDFNDQNGLGDARVSYYDVSGVPNCVASGNLSQGLPSIITQDLINYDIQKPGFFDISGTVGYANGSILVDLDFESYTSFTSGSLKAHVVIVEDVTYTTPPGSNGETEFADVMRYMYPGEAGSSLGLMSDGEIFNVNFTKAVDSPVLVENCKIIAFVQDDANKDVLMTKRFDLSDLCNVTADAVAYNIEEENGTGSAVVNVTSGIPPYTYLWDDSQNQTADSAINLVAGTYNVTVTDSVGCTTVASCEVMDVSSINPSVFSSLSIYPNPSEGKISIANAENSVIEIYSVLGNRLMSFESFNTITEIDLSSFKQGIYLMKLSKNDFSISKKIILNR